jgi:predicted Zn-dependent protease
VTAPQELVETALGSSGSDGCVVIVEEQSEVNLRWAANALTTNGDLQARTMTVIAVRERVAGRCTGIASRSVTTSEEVIALVRAADALARESPPNEDSSPLVEPAESDEGAGARWDAPVPRVSAEDLQPLTAELGAVCARWARSDRLMFGYAEHQLTVTFLGTSTGLRRRFDQPDGRCELTGKSGDLTRSAWHGQHLPSMAQLDLAAGVGALERGLGWAERQIDLPAGPYEALLPPSAVADLMLCLYGELGARDAAEGRSALSAPGGGDRIGEQLATLPLTLCSDPAHGDVACAPFALAGENSGLGSVFDNGRPVGRTDWIDRGRLNALIATRAWAKRSGSVPRPMVDNLILDGEGTASLEEMIAATERGLLLTSLWYMRTVDPQALLVTGLTRDGVYLVEDGHVTAAVNNFRFNESPLDMLRRVTEVGRTEHTLPREHSDYFRRTAMPALRVSDFGFSTVSDAR